MKLTLIGNGAMAKALAVGLVIDYDIEVLGRDESKLKTFQEDIKSQTSKDISIKVIDTKENIEGKNIILCVKPFSLLEVSKTLEGKANSIYSVLAGTTIESLKENIKAENYVRTMPNLSAAFLKSMTTITGDESLKDTALKIFSNIGKTLWVNTQKELDIATGIAGSGPAFLALVAEAIADGGVKCGLKRDDANTLVKGLFEGFAPLLKENTPATIKDNVMSPGGTTAAGYCAMEENGIRNGMIKGIEAAYNKAVELGKK